ncbi:MAG TPA: AtpZ/AtpI family protein [Natronincola sp.]|nr:AtpZ/AtpI family protein [Natronincola sp.]
MKESLKYLSLITQVGITIAISIITFIFLGVYLDRFFNLRGVFTLLSILVGCVSGIWLAYKLITKSLPKDSEKK